MMVSLQLAKAIVILSRMKKALVIIPTYNERETLPKIIASILKHEGFDVLVVDDSSPDGTALLVKELMSGSSRISLIERPGKLGLGTAYVEGFKWGLEKSYDYFIEMDADNSHDPDSLPLFIEELEKGFGLVIGSRYINRTISVVGWDFRRLLLSKFGNFYASRILGLRLTDLTSGFRCYSKEALEVIDVNNLHSNGYAFQIETAYRVSASGYRVGEIPIIFRERESGISKMSKQIIREAVVLPWKLRCKRLFYPVQLGMVRDVSYQIRTAAGMLLMIAGLVGSLISGWWLSTGGDVIEIIHQAKMSLPGWAWLVMKISLSAISAILLVALFLTLAIAIFAKGDRG
jgi:dolichol-phosphate mannosyltransferase